MAQEPDALRQNLGERGSFKTVYNIYLLFGDAGERPKTADLHQRLKAVFGEADLVAEVDDSLTSFAIPAFRVEYKDKQHLPAQVLLTDFQEFNADLIGEIDRTQMWECPDWQEILAGCTRQLMISDFMAGGLPYKERCEMLTLWAQVMLELCPDCLAVWSAPSGLLLSREAALANPYEEHDRFLHLGLHIRFFNIQGSGDMLVDTMGLYAVGLPDVQYHFKGCDPNDVVRHAFNVASYIFKNEAPVQNGETIAGFGDDGELDGSVKWECRYEQALIQPVRDVMDIRMGGYAAGQRD